MLKLSGELKKIIGRKAGHNSGDFGNSGNPGDPAERFIISVT
jgi:hypothetical protein